MHIADIFARDSVTFSFEFFPPRTDEAWSALFARIADFERLEPSFVSVTYGAGGSTREQTHELVLRLRRETALEPIPHLTCVCHAAAEIQLILERYAAAGVNTILALAGDPPADRADHDRSRDDFRYAIDLVRFIRAFGERGGCADRRGFGIGVAGFPEGHPGTLNRLREMDFLKAKVDAGADYVCTQMFFDNAEFYDWRERCELAGIRVPLIAGIMPITSLRSMERMADLAAGTRFPARLLKRLGRRPDDAYAVRQEGILWATEQCRDLLDHGVSGLHFYTLNQSDATRQIYQTLGARNSAALR
ncbi:MAG: methylenetetrahydrofolate reductase [NAD(P)H] [Phycisphaeraceae bacterium]|nr:methylenetetrahydrofolate reductase [NAD(P)H] [Phycisphaeraceae bacterium]